LYIIVHSSKQYDIHHTSPAEVTTLRQNVNRRVRATSNDQHCDAAGMSNTILQGDNGDHHCCLTWHINITQAIRQNIWIHQLIICDHREAVAGLCLQSVRQTSPDLTSEHQSGETIQHPASSTLRRRRVSCIGSSCLDRLYSRALSTTTWQDMTHFTS